MLEIGSLVDGKYKILNIVGKGGMSIVYLAMNEKVNMQNIKLLEEKTIILKIFNNFFILTTFIL